MTVDMDYGFTDDLPNSVIPTSVRGMLTEEWTIDPFSPMPSFLERVFMQEAQDSCYRGIETAHQLLIDYLERALLALSGQPSGPISTISSANNNRSPTRWDKATHYVRELSRHGLRRILNAMRRNKISILCLLIYVIERMSLERSSCLLSESFYSGRRVKLSASVPGSSERKTLPLNTKDKVRLASLMALSMYLKGKLDALHVYWKRYPRQMRSDKQSLFVTAYPWVRASAQLVSVLCKWNYLMGTSPFFDLPSAALQHWVRRVSRDEAGGGQNTTTLTPPSTSADVQRVNEHNGGQQGTQLQHVSKTLAICMLVSWLTWCRSIWPNICREESKDEVMPLPPSPPLLHSNKVENGACCICRRHPPVQPTACTVSGHVGCEKCMTRFLQDNLRCPVTNYPCNSDSWVRLYEPRA